MRTKLLSRSVTWRLDLHQIGKDMCSVNIDQLPQYLSCQKIGSHFRDFIVIMRIYCLHLFAFMWIVFFLGTNTNILLRSLVAWPATGQQKILLFIIVRKNNGQQQQQQQQYRFRKTIWFVTLNCKNVENSLMMPCRLKRIVKYRLNRKTSQTKY